MSLHRRPVRGRRTGLAAAALAVAALTILGASAPALAAKGGGGKPSGGGTSGTTNISLVLLNSSDGSPHYAQDVTFQVSSTSTQRPFVGLSCYQGGTRVYSMSAGFFPDYPFTTTYQLTSSMWTGGAADCTATAYYFTNNGAERVIGTKNFGVLG